MLNTLNLSALSKPSVHSGFIARFAFAAIAAFAQKQIVTAIRMTLWAVRDFTPKRGESPIFSESSAICRCPITQALPAFTGAAISSKKILAIVRVPSWAVVLLGIFGTWAYSTQNVFTAGNGFQVTRITASAIPAQVVELHAIGYFTNKPSVRFSVNGDNHMFAVRFLNGSQSVATGKSGMRPFPALPEMSVLQRDKSVEICHVFEYMSTTPDTSTI